MDLTTAQRIAAFVNEHDDGTLALRATPVPLSDGVYAVEILRTEYRIEGPDQIVSKKVHCLEDAISTLGY